MAEPLIPKTMSEMEMDKLDKLIEKQEQHLEMYSGKKLTIAEALACALRHYNLATLFLKKYKDRLPKQEFYETEKKNWSVIRATLLEMSDCNYLGRIKIDSFLLSPFYVFFTEPKGCIKTAFIGRPGKTNYRYLEKDHRTGRWVSHETGVVTTPEITTYVTEFRKRKRAALAEKYRTERPSIVNLVDPDLESASASTSSSSSSPLDVTISTNDPKEPLPCFHTAPKPTGILLNSNIVLPTNSACNCVSSVFQFTKGSETAPGSYRLVVFDNTKQRDEFCKSIGCQYVLMNIFE